MNRFWQLVIALTVSGLVLYALLGRFDLHGTMVFVRGADASRLMTGVALMILSYFLRGARWTIWERSLTYWDSLRLILIGFMGNNVLPARLGELLRAHCAAAVTADDRGRTTALGSIVAERTLDGVTLATFGLVSVALVTVDHRLEWALFGISIAFAGLGCALLCGACFHRRIRSLIGVARRKFPGHITAFAGEKIAQFIDGLLPLATTPRLVAAVALTTLIWTVEVWCCYLIGTAVWNGMSLPLAHLMLVVVNFASLVPFTIGGIGTVEAIAPFYLISAGWPPPAALATVLLQHAAQYLFTTITGAVLYIWGGFYRLPFAQPKRTVTRQTREVSPSPDATDASIVAETRSSLLRYRASLKPASRDEPQLSIVIPAYNEQSRLPRTVLATLRWCSALSLDFELIIVDDGSGDETLALARLFEDSDVRIRTLACPHTGKGATVRLGVLNARGRVVMFMDADGATPLDEIPKLLGAIDSGYDVAIGSRVLQRPGEIEVTTSLHRRLIGRAFALCVNLFAIDGIGDTQCGFKAFRRSAVPAIFSRQRILGFAFDVEILFIARRLGLSIVEIPVNWQAQPGSKVNLVTDSIRMLWDISHVRWLHRGSLRGRPGVENQELRLDEGKLPTRPSG
jgi:dolichyl-phosphate beta-glucosyltransferase